MLRLTILGAGLMATAAALAQGGGTSQPRTARHGPSGDPTEIVCVNEAAIGSRLSRRRVCRTRAEWEEHRAEYKQEVERAQQQMQTHYTDPGG